ncbi:MAG: hypothetical protein ABSC54_11880 [Smithellaceae bacterium]
MSWGRNVRIGLPNGHPISLASANGVRHAAVTKRRAPDTIAPTTSEQAR